jgi:hypothetical protein
MADRQNVHRRLRLDDCIRFPPFPFTGIENVVIKPGLKPLVPGGTADVRSALAAPDTHRLSAQLA